MVNSNKFACKFKNSYDKLVINWVKLQKNKFCAGCAGCACTCAGTNFSNLSKNRVFLRGKPSYIMGKDVKNSIFYEKYHFVQMCRLCRSILVLVSYKLYKPYKDLTINFVNYCSFTVFFMVFHVFSIVFFVYSLH